MNPPSDHSSSDRSKTPPRTPSSKNSAEKYDLLRSEERISELRSIQRQSSVGEIAMKFGGKSLVESRQDFQSKQRNSSQKELLFRGAIHYYQYNKNNTVDRKGIKDIISRKQYYVPSPTKKSAQELVQKIPSLAASSSDHAQESLAKISKERSSRLSSLENVSVSQIQSKFESKRPVNSGKELRSVSSDDYEVVERVVDFPTDVELPGVELKTLEDFQSFLCDFGLDSETIDAADLKDLMVAFESAIDDERNGTLSNLHLPKGTVSFDDDDQSDRNSTIEYPQTTTASSIITEQSARPVSSESTSITQVLDEIPPVREYPDKSSNSEQQMNTEVIEKSDVNPLPCDPIENNEIKVTTTGNKSATVETKASNNSSSPQTPAKGKSEDGSSKTTIFGTVVATVVLMIISYIVLMPSSPGSSEL
jgi:hypothetical protein